MKMSGKDMTKLCLLIDCGGNPAGTTMAVKDIVFKENTGEEPDPEPVVEPYDYDTSCNLFKSATTSTSFYYAPSWNQLPDPAVAVEDGDYTFTYEAGTNETWQSQFFLDTDIATDAETKYDYSVTITTSEAVGAVTVKLYQKGKDQVVYAVDTYSSVAGVAKVIRHEEMNGIDLTDLRLLVDCGGNPAGTTVTVSKPVFKDSSCEASGIATIKGTATASDRAYNLAGQRVDDSFKGVRIQNGKKFIAK